MRKTWGSSFVPQLRWESKGSCSGLAVAIRSRVVRCGFRWARSCSSLMFRSKNLEADLAMMEDRFGFELFGTVLDENAINLSEVTWPKRSAILFGNEYHGLSESLLGRKREANHHPHGPVASTR